MIRPPVAAPAWQQIHPDIWERWDLGVQAVSFPDVWVVYAQGRGIVAKAATLERAKVLAERWAKRAEFRRKRREARAELFARSVLRETGDE